MPNEGEQEGQQQPREPLDEARNPFRAKCPDYRAFEWDDERQRLVAAGTVADDDEAVTHLVARWEERIALAKDDWLQRGGQQPPEGEPPADLPQARSRANSGASRRPSRAPSVVPDAPQANDDGDDSDPEDIRIPFGQAGPDFIADQPSLFAQNKITKREYIELYYFTVGARQRARRDQLALNEDVLTLERSSSSFALKTPVQASLEARRDDQLSWDEVMQARPQFLLWIEKLGWPPKWVKMHAAFFYRLDSHEMRSQPGGTEALALYQAKYRREWHISVTQRKLFDLSEINETAMQHIKTELIQTQLRGSLQQWQSEREALRSELKRRASSPPPAQSPTKRQKWQPPRTPSRFPSRRDHAAPSPQSGRSFRQGADGSALVICAICLGRHPLNEVSKCTLSVTWDGRPAACIRDGNGNPAVPTPVTPTDTVVRVAAATNTEPIGALVHRRSNPLTPLHADEWERLLRDSALLERYPRLVHWIRHGFITDIPPIYTTFTPPNSATLELHRGEFNRIVRHEFDSDCYIGPFSRSTLESLIGPFQSSPLSLVPKPHKEDVYRLVQNFSYPHTPSHGISSINSHINSDDWPCTWGTFDAFALLCWRLPPGSQGAVRDISEAYRQMPLHPSQWPGTVVRLGEDSFAVDPCASFGVASHAGAYGYLGDAFADILRFHGIGPIAKWVDDSVFLRILRAHLDDFNHRRSTWRAQVVRNGGRKQDGGRIWFGGDILPDGRSDQFVEDMAFPVHDLSGDSPRSADDLPYTYCLADIDRISNPLGIIWQREKDIPFSSRFPFTGFEWNLGDYSVAIPRKKAEKYIRAIDEWLLRRLHSLREVQKLHGKLWHASLVVQQGRGYLTSLESFLGLFHDSPFKPRTPPQSTASDLRWWRATLQRSDLHREIPGPREVWNPSAFSDASSGTGIGIILNGHWRAWRLLPGWRSDERDIGWAEAVGMELLVRSILSQGVSNLPLPDIQVFGDNRGVVEGWWKGRSRNRPTNVVFRRLAAFLEEHSTRIHTRYVESAHNPADGPSRGKFPPQRLLLPPLTLPSELQPFLVDFDSPFSAVERRLQESGQPLEALSKPSVSEAEAKRRHHNNCEYDNIQPWRGSFWSDLHDIDIQRIVDVTSQSWAESTAGTYGSGLLVFHVFCDARGVAEEQRTPAGELLILAFVASIAGAYSSSAILNYVNGVRAWHIIHGLEWTVDKDRLKAAINGASKLVPAALKKKKREPVTVALLHSLATQFDLTVPFDAAVWACMLVSFFSLARLGELTVKNQGAFKHALHPSRSSLRFEQHRGGSEVRCIFLPCTKAAPQGEDISFARQSSPIDPWSALDNHLQLNNLAEDPHIFAYKRHPTDAVGVPLTKPAFNKRMKAALTTISAPAIHGHSLRIGGTLEYLLRGLSFETVKAIGRWKSDAFTLYLRKHAQVLAPYLQDHTDTWTEVSCSVIQLPPVR
ncbi:hypothetical protein TRAPUB_4081 [Trametes pubescens]|uniref:Tyr recombinase domain-containing protein n=1 Tax=Trametes pubescens TaxID=154538 RepID=A0A1M2VBW7_TRAPU|nr:hypothetical protein TRAPUB_4081 [Trametes pubescens]